jgi:HK97 family phage major capsid protein
MTKIKIPESPMELAEILNDTARMKEVFADKESFKEFINAYARTVAPQDGVIAAQVREQTQQVVAEMLKMDRKGGPPVNLAGNDGASLLPVVGGMPKSVSNGKGAVYNRASHGAKLEREIKDQGFGSIGEYCQAIYAEKATSVRNRQALLAKLERVREIQNSFGSEVPADGGLLIPEIQRSELLQLALEDALVRPRATVIPMQTLKTYIPAVDETSHVSSLFGGVTFFWTEEGAQLAESQASFAKIALDVKKLTGFFKAPNELLADAPAFTTWFDSRIPAGLAWQEDVSFMTSTGVGEPLGFVNCPAAVVQAAEAGQPTATLVWENIVKMYSRMLPSSLGKAVWLAAIDTFPQLATMALSVGTGGAPVWLNNGTVGPPMSILGRPVYFTEKLPALGTTGDICFADLSYYLIGDRQMAQISASEHFAFQNDQTAFKIIERVDGRPWLQSALTPHNNSSNTLSAFVQLASR